jgi:hypothetical protein
MEESDSGSEDGGAGNEAEMDLDDVNEVGKETIHIPIIRVSIVFV